MRYIEKNDNVTREYEVLIDENKLVEVIKKLNEKCSRSVMRIMNVTSTTREKAIEKINANNKDGISVIREVREADDTLSGQRMFECEICFVQNPYLAYLLNACLASYRSNADLSFIINQLIEYENNDELKPYSVRLAEKGGMVNNQELYYEYENNQDFDFELLRNLYQEAKDCFKLAMISETKYYEPEDNCKKLGR
jgi:hypothetical protein